MKRILWGQQEMTTTELLVAALFAAVLLGTLYGFYREQLYNLLSEEVKTSTLEDARGALDIMARELRNAGSFPLTTDPSCLKDGSGNPLRVISASSTSIHIQTDTQSTGGGDPDGKCTATGENVTYDIGKATETCPGTILRRDGKCLVANVVIPPGAQLFTYFDTAHTQLPPNPPVASIKMVKIVFSVQVPEPTPQGKASGRTITSTLASSVEFRN